MVAKGGFWPGKKVKNLGRSKAKKGFSNPKGTQVGQNFKK